MKIYHIKKITLNNDGKVIGEIVKFKLSYKKAWQWAYYSVRRPIHFFCKYHGFGIDKALLRNLMETWHLDSIIIHYIGKVKEVYFLSNIDDWYLHGIDVEYSKDYGNNGSTFGCQKILDKKYMKEIA